MAEGDEWSEGAEPQPSADKEATVYRSALGEVTPEVGALFDRMNSAASVTWSWMTMGWHRRRRPNEKLDLGALQGALYLEARCSEALADPTAFLHPNTNQLRYDLFAGALAVQRVLPIPADERPPLLQTMSQWHRGYERWRTEPSEHHAKLIADWRRWLRSDGIGRAALGSELHGEASILAAASRRIIEALNPGRGGTGYVSNDVRTLALPVEREPWRY